SGGDRTMLLGPGEEISLAEGEAVPKARVELPASPVPSETPSAEASAPPPQPAAPAAPEGASAADLFPPADAARAGGTSAEALRLLHELVQRYPRDGRATLALFTIGRLEQSRGRSAAAARAFESCGGALHGEAMAEAALAWSAAGDRGRAGGLA